MLLALLTLLSTAVLFASLIALPFRRFRTRAKWIAAGSFVLVITSLILVNGEIEREAQEAGWRTASDRTRAAEAGIQDPAAWSAQESARVNREAEEAAQRQAARERLLEQPSVQTKFVDAVEKARVEFAAADTDFKRGATRPARAKAICQRLNSRKLEGWVGRVSTLSTNGDGHGVVSVEIGDNIYLTTWNNALSDYSDKTLVSANSALYQALASLKVGDHVRVNGYLFQSDTDCVSEQSLTIAGSIKEPAFTMRFTIISKIELPKD